MRPTRSGIDSRNREGGRQREGSPIRAASGVRAPAQRGTRRSGICVVNVRRLRNPTLIHRAFGSKLARGLVPPDRARLALLLHQIGLLLQELANELRVLGFVQATGKHHGAIPEGVRIILALALFRAAARAPVRSTGIDGNCESPQDGRRVSRSRAECRTRPSTHEADTQYIDPCDRKRGRGAERPTTGIWQALEVKEAATFAAFPRRSRIRTVCI